MTFAKFGFLGAPSELFLIKVVQTEFAKSPQGIFF